MHKIWAYVYPIDSVVFGIPYKNSRVQEMYWLSYGNTKVYSGPYKETLMSFPQFQIAEFENKKRHESPYKLK